MGIYPSVLETDINEFWNQIKHLSPFFNYFQIDITDGKFVENKTIQPQDLLATLQDNKSFLQNKSIEIHLMVEDVNYYLNELKKLSLNIKYVLFPITSFTDFHQNTFVMGTVLNPEDLIENHWNSIKTYEVIQLMTVHPGSQHQPFIPEVLEKINQLRERGYKGQINLDGGLNDETLPLILQNKFLPDNLFPGSYLKEDTEERLRKLNEELKMRN